MFLRLRFLATTLMSGYRTGGGRWGYCSYELLRESSGENTFKRRRKTGFLEAVKKNKKAEREQDFSQVVLQSRLKSAIKRTSS